MSRRKAVVAAGRSALAVLTLHTEPAEAEAVLMDATPDLQQLLIGEADVSRQNGSASSHRLV